MSNKKLREKKAKAKERATEEQKHKSRLFEIRRKRADRERDRLERQYRERQEPIRRDSKIEKLEENIEHNLEVLKALEAEYIEAQKTKSNLQEELEAEGYATIEEKIEAIKLRSQEMVEKIQLQAETENVADEILEQLMPLNESTEPREIEFKNKVRKNSK